MVRILIVDDDPSHSLSVASVLKRQNYEVVTAPDGESGIREIDNGFFDLVLTDLVMPGIGGIGVLKHVISRSPKTKCIILTGHGSIKNTVEAIKIGAFDYIPKPVTAGELLINVENALKFKKLEEENFRLKRELKQKYSKKNIIGTSSSIQKIFELIDKVADTDSTILIYGPSGTGKELIARAIHYGSSRSDKPIVIINCGAIPEALLESELFGHEKGSFTGAHKTRIGRFEMANGGTIFLDEIGEMSPALQVKLLRVLQDQRFERVGATKTTHVDVRIIAATNKNLTEEINKGTFREDLYYRLNVIPIKLPSLKQRRSDIPLLISHFLKKFSNYHKCRIEGFSKEAVAVMLEYDWPGNVRELENVIKRTIILSETPIIGFEDLPEHIQQNSVSVRTCNNDTDTILEEGLSLEDAVKCYERKIILNAMEKSDGIKTKAAKLLNIKRTTLVEKIKKQNFAKTASA